MCAHLVEPQRTLPTDWKTEDLPRISRNTSERLNRTPPGFGRGQSPQGRYHGLKGDPHSMTLQHPRETDRGFSLDGADSMEMQRSWNAINTSHMSKSVRP